MKLSLMIAAILSVGLTPTNAQTELSKDQVIEALFIANRYYLSPAFDYSDRSSCGTNAKGESTGCCGGIPIGVYRVGYDNQALARMLLRFREAGIIKIMNVDASTGRGPEPLKELREQGLGTAVKTELSADVDQSQITKAFLSVDAQGKPVVRDCFRYGTPTLKEVVRFDKIHAPGNDGIGFDAYVVQGTFTYEPSALELKLDPSIRRDRKFQAVLRYDPFSKKIGIVAAQSVDMSTPFNAAYFSSKLGR
ncbi:MULTISPECIES: hypothetical protein [unclassified Bradyrhizobium]|uniref:hypothetical protein n=1 Tax=unclassified Bradyrhizobium TaxID=2631580 RepID=UPI00291702A2|nr:MULTISPECIES: hypothetical protein [unclassified Bradyrhizobium]